MTARLTAAIIAATLTALAGIAHAETAIVPPPGAFAMCEHFPAFCEPRDAVSVPQSALSTLLAVNALVNGGIKPDPTYRTAYGRPNAYEVAPYGALGSCIQYALTKEFLLSWRGVPVGAMRLAQVHVPGASDLDQHMILLVRVNGTEYVLDNLTDDIVAADQRGYGWLAVQDDRIPSIWRDPMGTPQ